MIAVDTNVVVRFLVRDDERQWRAAANVFERSPVVLLTSVLMETEWVLRKVYQLKREEIFEGISKLCGADGISLESGVVFPKALNDYHDGWDLADAVHLRQSEALNASAFASFDRSLRRRSERRQSAVPVMAP